MISLAGQRLAVVGNARSLLSHTHGGAIEEHDLVLRMNRGLPVDSVSQGQRTDILAFSTFRAVADIHSKFGDPYLVWMSPKLRDPSLVACDFYPLERWEALAASLGTRPSVGAMVLDHVSACDLAGLSIYGMDFKRSPTTYTAVEHRGPHDYDAEERFCETLVRRHGWTHVRDCVDAGTILP